jgi:predicted metal-dependent phosphoesterase TrpH
MTEVDPFRAPGTWLRAALHAHTTNSDGELPPWALAAHYAAAGYDVLATTDHWIRTEIAEQDARGLVVLPSVELNARLPHDRDGHLLSYGVDRVPDELMPFATLEDGVRFVEQAGGVPYLAHPYWTGADFDALDVDGLRGIEVWNGGCDREISRGGSEPHWDDALQRGRLLYGVAADDSHHPGHDSDLAWTWIRAAERTPAAVLDALRSGAFYSSAGPSILEVAIDDDAIEVATSPCRSVTLCQGMQRGSSAQAGRLGYRYGARVLETTFDGSLIRVRLERREAVFGRVQVEDANGRRAWTNPLWLS